MLDYYVNNHNGNGNIKNKIGFDSWGNKYITE